MRTILVDPYTKTISEVNYTGDYREIYTLIDCETFTVHSLGGVVDAFLDDSGNWRQTEWFRFKHPGAPKILFCGRMLVSATNPSTGESMELPQAVTVQDLESGIEWLDDESAIAYAEECQAAVIEQMGNNPDVIYLDDGLVHRIKDVVDQKRKAGWTRWDNLNNPNSGSLEDMACPRCGSLGNFRIEVMDVVTMSDDDGAIDRDYNAEFDESSECACIECDYTATVAEFLTGEPAKAYWTPKVKEMMAEAGWVEATEAELAKHRTKRDTVWVYTWSRDCDMCEGDGINEIPASLKAFFLFMCDFENGLEGAGHCHIISEQEAAEFEPTRRDRAMEAFENGRGANAFSV